MVMAIGPGFAASVNVTESPPGTVAVIWPVAAVGVNVLLDCPLGLVAVVPDARLPPVGVHVTVTPDTATPLWVTRRTSAPRGVTIVPVWLLPETMLMTNGAGLAPSLNVTELPPGTLAVIWPVPVVGVNVLLDWPFAPVAVVPDARLPPVGVHVTVTPDAATPFWVTLTTSGANGAPIVPVWLLPETMLKTNGAVLAISLKVTELPPGTLAVIWPVPAVGVNVLLDWPFAPVAVVPDARMPPVGVHVTVTPDGATPVWGTFTTRGANGVRIVPVWLLPEAVLVKDGAGLALSLNVTEPTPAMVALIWPVPAVGVNVLLDCPLAAVDVVPDASVPPVAVQVTVTPDRGSRAGGARKIEGFVATGGTEGGTTGVTMGMAVACTTSC